MIQADLSLVLGIQKLHPFRRRGANANHVAWPWPLPQEPADLIAQLGPLRIGSRTSVPQEPPTLAGVARDRVCAHTHDGPGLVGPKPQALQER